MARSKKVETFTKLDKGIFTEAGSMTFPAEASQEELNWQILRDGSRRRRLGLALAGNPVIGVTVQDGDHIEVFEWVGAGGIASLNLLILQVGHYLYFFRQLVDDGNLASGLLKARIDLSAFSSIYTPSGFVASDRVSVTATGGRLVVAGRGLDTFVVTYDNQVFDIFDESFTTGGVSSLWIERIKFRVRDFQWQSKRRSGYSQTVNYGSASNLIAAGPARYYDTLNSGWRFLVGRNILKDEFLDNNWMPALSIPFFVGKDSTGGFDFAIFQSFENGSPGFGNGSYVMSLYYPRRDLLFVGYEPSDIESLVETSSVPDSPAPVDVYPDLPYLTLFDTSELNSPDETSRFTCVASMAGRVFYSGMTSTENGSRIFFSVANEAGGDLGILHQVNDPTSEFSNDLLDTDGGVIYIPEAANIKVLHVFGASLYAFADNGVWEISGVDDVFRAQSYSVSKISERGLTYENSFISAAGRPYWLCDSGIFTFGSADGSTLNANSITLVSIDKFMKELTTDQLSEFRSSYDSNNQVLYFTYPSTDGQDTHALVHDLANGSFAPLKFSSLNFTLDRFFFPTGSFSSTIPYNVIDSNGAFVMSSGGAEVIVNKTIEGGVPRSLTALIVGLDGAIYFGSLSDTTFMDFGDTYFETYLETGPNFLGVAGGRKSVPILNVFAKITEEGYHESGVGYIRPSDLLVSAYFNSRTTISSRPQKGYRRPGNLFSGHPSFVNQTELSKVRLRLRGTGYNVRLRFESQPGCDIHLVGYSIESDSNE